LGPADRVLNSVAAPMSYCCVAFGAKFDTKREEGKEVSKNYKTGSFVICAAEQTIFGC
jgi:hypothetical protein